MFEPFTLTVPLLTPVMLEDLDLTPTLDALLASALYRGEGVPLEALHDQVARVLDSERLPDGQRLYHASSMLFVSQGFGAERFRAGALTIYPCGLTGPRCGPHYYKEGGGPINVTTSKERTDDDGHKKSSRYRTLYAPQVRFDAVGDMDEVRHLLGYIPGIGKCAVNRGAGAWNVKSAEFRPADDERAWLLTRRGELARPVPRDWSETEAAALGDATFKVRTLGAWTFPYWQETGPCLIPPWFLTCAPEDGPDSARDEEDEDRELECDHA